MKAFIPVFLCFLVSCIGESQSKQAHRLAQFSNPDVIINSSGKRVSDRFKTPKGFKRVPYEPSSFQHYLQNLPLKSHNAQVKLYNGKNKSPSNVHAAVVDLNIGKKNLHQCADAVMRLRAEYLWNNKAYDKIHFNFTNGFQVDYSEWMKGRRVIVNGNTTYWNNESDPSNTYTDFWDYLELIFTYAGTLSLSKELDPVPFSEMQVGDVLIQGGSPGHAVIVVDMAENATSGEKVYLLAQSYMPAQEIHVLKNYDSELSPWYILADSTEIATPEWTFSNSDLKRF